MKLDEILVPVDFSPGSRLALQRALEWAERFDASILVLHVAPRIGDYMPLDEWIWGDDSEKHTLDDRIRVQADEQLEQLLTSLPDEQRARVRGRVERGVPHDAILRAAEEEDTDLIVIATHGRTGMKRLFLGSVAERIVRHAPCAVLTLR
jgi:nucleotide-binding universal stress UspA family protein